MVMNPGIDPSLQNISTMQWGFSFDYVYNSPDKFRNGKFLTANMVYTDVQRTDNEATGFGMASDSYRICTEASYAMLKSALIPVLLPDHPIIIRILPQIFITRYTRALPDGIATRRTAT